MFQARLSPVHIPPPHSYADPVDVAINEFRAGLRGSVDRVQRGEDVVVTERGVPVARLVPVESSGLLARLEDEGVLTRAPAPRPRASGHTRVRGSGPVADLVAELRR